MTIAYVHVQGYCPVCGSTMLHVRKADGSILCFNDGCPDPRAVVKILADPEIHHVVELGEDTFNLKHPLRERIDDALLNCQIGNDLAALSGRPHPGRWRIVENGNGGWSFEAA